MFKALVVISLALSLAFACTADCKSCHPGLDTTTDERHMPLATCVECHPPESFTSAQMNTGCGTDCFQCHNVNKLTQMPQHEVIGTCIECHDSLKQTLFIQMPDTIKSDFTLFETLKK